MSDTIIILGSARKDSHTRTLLRNVFTGIPHQLIDLLDHEIAPFDYSSNYPNSDQFLQLADLMAGADNIVLATPVYWYSMSGVLKTFMDRFTDLVSVEKDKGRALRGKNVFLFSVGADVFAPEGFEVPFKRTAEYLNMNYHEGVYISSRGENFEGVQTAIKAFERMLG
ncbi:MAG: NAD(P)H-dependent oxidoreductase [Flavobacteriales bacterium]|nr:NAD(P)H-dependent oxidoreductase [Flavobacteriales bacterium]